ncbi:MAG: arsenate reductase (glutaredoxin) [Gammaproteobacteria bacterium]|nr:arsenate reductase (glutaredoxin) [Gammaproteobacteria bacterium]
MEATIYHNSRCSKCRSSLALLNENGIDPEIINYLDNPPTQAELKHLLQLLGKQPQDVIRFNEGVAKDLGLSAKDDRSADEWIKLMITNPVLIERPIVVIDDKAVLGRPPENILSII